LEDAYSQLAMSGKFRDSTGNPKQDFETNLRLELFRNQGRSLVITTPYKEDGELSTGSRNVVYQGPLNAYRLKRVDGAYIVEYWGDDPKQVSNDLGMYWAYTSVPIQVYGVSVREMIDSPGFTLKDAKRIQTESGERIRFDYRYQKDPAKPSFREGWWTVDPGLGWVVREYEFSGSGIYAQAPVIGSQEYKKNVSGGVPALAKAQFSWKPEGSWVERSFEVEECLLGSCPDEPFRLSTYGLGHLDPDHNAWSWSWPLLFVIMAVACLILGLTFRHLAGKRKAAQ
jgi:hypothetical protein